MPFIRQDPLPTEATVRRELKIMRQGTNKLLKSKKTARDFLYKHGFITRDGQLTQRYGGPGEANNKPPSESTAQ